MVMAESRPIYPKAFVEQPTPPRSSCFIVMPFAKEFDGVHRSIRAACEAISLAPVRADDVFLGKPVLEKILRGIEECAIVVADVTGRNANVFYELGIAHVRKEHVVLVTQSIEDVPFDLKHLDLLRYEPSLRGRKRLQVELTTILKQFVEAPRHDPRAGDVRILHWAIAPKPRGGLHVHNIGKDYALDLVAERLMPTGAFETSVFLKSLGPGERGYFSDGWASSARPEDAPACPPEKYVTRVSWKDSTDGSHRTDWKVTDKTR